MGPMDLELTCPSCDQILVLDAGFAGGVCRCSSCGTLMTVPHASPSSQNHTTHTRPDSPNETLGTESTDLQDAAIEKLVSATTPQVSSAAPKGQNQTPSPKTPTRKKSHPDAIATTIRLNRRFAIRAAFVSTFLFISGMTIFAISLFYHFQASELARLREHPEVIVTFEYDPAANPFLLDKPNFLGIQLSPSTAIVVDTPTSSSHWLGLIKEAIVSGTDFDTSAVAVQLQFSSQDEPAVYPENFTHLADLHPDELRQYLNGNLAMGTTDPVNAIHQALTTNPVQLIFVTGQKLSSKHVKAIQTLIQSKPSTRFDVVLVGDQNLAIQTLTSVYSGQCVVMTAKKLNDLFYDMR